MIDFRDSVLSLSPRRFTATPSRTILVSKIARTDLVVFFSMSPF
jgi:hypothetical protein